MLNVLKGVSLLLLINLVMMNLPHSETGPEQVQFSMFTSFEEPCVNVEVCEEQEIRTVEADPWDINSLEEERRLLELSHTTKKVSDYIKRFHPTARMEEKRYGVPYSISMAQGLLESESGNSRLAKQANNHFGIKGKLRGGLNLCDDSCNDYFNIYENAWASWRAHSQLLMKKRYKPLHEKKFDKKYFQTYSANPGRNYRNDGSHYTGKDPNFNAKLKNLERYWDVPYKRWAYGLDILGYATSNRYAESLIKLVETNKLQEYDGVK